MIRHFVHLRFAKDVTSDSKQEIYDQLAGLDDHIDGILDFHHHQNVSVETPVVRGFNDMFWFDFRDSAVRDAYLEHPRHQDIGKRILACLDDGWDGLFVCDVEL